MKARADGFWHGPVPADALCLYRAGFGVLLCWETLTWLPHTTELFSSAGFHLGPYPGLAPPPAIAAALCVVLLVASGLVVVGWRTRIALATTFAIRLFLYEVDRINEKSVDSIVLVVLAVLLLSDCNARWSLDDRRRAARGTRQPALVCAFPQRLLQLEFAQVYFFAGLTKMVSPDWVNGTVLAQLLASRWATELGVRLSGAVPDAAIRAAAIGTILYELLAGFLLFVPWARPAVIAAGVVLHASIQATLQVGVLGPHFVWALLVLFPDPHTVAGR